MYKNNPSITYKSAKDWQREGFKRFGSDPSEWRFVCPRCKNEATPADFEAVGGDKHDSYQEWIGRHTGGLKGPHKCDWAAYGLFSGPSFVVIDDGDKMPVFNFAEVSVMERDNEPKS